MYLSFTGSASLLKMLQRQSFDDSPKGTDWYEELSDRKAHFFLACGAPLYLCYLSYLAFGLPAVGAVLRIRKFGE